MQQIGYLEQDAALGFRLGYFQQPESTEHDWKVKMPDSPEQPTSVLHDVNRNMLGHVKHKGKKVGDHRSNRSMALN